MARRGASGSPYPVILLVLLLGIGLNTSFMLDIYRYHWWLGNTSSQEDNSSTEIEKLKQSIVLVKVPGCDPGVGGSGTGFVVKAGYIATAAHVVAVGKECKSKITIVDSKGLEHDAELAGMEEDSDLALLSLTTPLDLPPLQLADSTLYEANTDLTEVLTIGYPLVGLASSSNGAAVSGKGNISHFDAEKNVFITSGLNLNAGNSGGPILLRENWKVLGVAVKKVDVTVGEGLGVSVPSKTLKVFFRGVANQDL